MNRRINGKGLFAYDAARNDLPLAVNVAGDVTLSFAFDTENSLGRHDFYLLYLVSGELEILCRRGWENLKAGGAVVFYPGTPYRYVSRGGEVMKYYFVHYSGIDAGRFTERCGFADHEPFFPGIRESLLNSVETLIHEQMSKKPLWEMRCCGEITNLLTELSRCAAGSVELRLEKSLGYIHRCYTSPVSVGELAKMEHLSPGRYRAVFLQNFKKSPKEYVISLRLEKSRQLLADTRLSVAEVSEAAGFSDPLYFSRVFRKKLGVSPTAYRRSVSPQ